MLCVAEQTPVSGVPSPPRLRSGRRARALFLRHYQACGVVRRAAQQAGIGRSTLYRWRDQDLRFRARWDSMAEQHRHRLEDTLMEISLEGERVPVFHKGVQVGWQQKNRLKATIALLAHFDRREKWQVAEQEKAEKRAALSHVVVSNARVSHAKVSHAVSPPAPAACPAAEKPAPVSHADDTRPQDQNPALVPHSGGRFRSKIRSDSTGWIAKGSRKTPPPPAIPHRLQDDWKLPLPARRPSVPPGPFRPAAVAAAAMSRQPALRPFM